MANALLIHNTVFNYVCIKNPKLEFEAKVDPKGDHINKEYIVDVLMPYASWKKFKKLYKSVGAVEKAKSFTAAEYEASFKVAPPTDKKYQDEDGDFTVIKFRQRAYYKDSGDKTKQPRVAGATEIKNGNGDVIGYKDSEGLDVGVDIEIGNGSSGTLQFRERSWTFGGKQGLSLDLLAIQVKTLIEYEGSDELGFDMDEEVEEGGNPFGGGDDLGSDDELPGGEKHSDSDEGSDDGW